jgi:hypothetical protein
VTEDLKAALQKCQQEVEQLKKQVTPRKHRPRRKARRVGALRALQKEVAQLKVEVQQLRTRAKQEKQIAEEVARRVQQQVLRAEAARAQAEAARKKEAEARKAAEAALQKLRLEQRRRNAPDRDRPEDGNPKSP